MNNQQSPQKSMDEVYLKTWFRTTLKFDELLVISSLFGAVVSLIILALDKTPFHGLQFILKCGICFFLIAILAGLLIIKKNADLLMDKVRGLNTIGRENTLRLLDILTRFAATSGLVCLLTYFK